MGLTPWAKPQWLQNAAGIEMPVEQFLQLTGAGLTSLTDDPVNERTVATLAGGGAGVALGRISDEIQDSTGTSKTFSPGIGQSWGLMQNLGLPSWLSAPGVNGTFAAIITPGLYAWGAFVSLTANPTTAGLYATLQTPFIGTAEVIALDGMKQAAAFGAAGIEEIVAFAAADLPAMVAGNLSIPADATAKLTVTAFVWRLAH